MVVVMLNLLISIIGNTYGQVSEVNELIYEKNRLQIIQEIISSERYKSRLSSLQNQYLITVYRENPLNAEVNIEKKLNNMEEKLNVLFYFFL